MAIARSRNLPKPTLAVLAVLAALLAAVLLAREIIIRNAPAPNHQAAAILAAEVKARQLRAHADDDPDLDDDERELGAMWARTNHAADPGQCPRHSAAFELGCRAYAEGRR